MLDRHHLAHHSRRSGDQAHTTIEPRTLPDAPFLVLLFFQATGFRQVEHFDTHTRTHTHSSFFCMEWVTGRALVFYCCCAWPTPNPTTKGGASGRKKGQDGHVTRLFVVFPPTSPARQTSPPRTASLSTASTSSKPQAVHGCDASDQSLVHPFAPFRGVAGRRGAGVVRGGGMNCNGPHARSLFACS